MTAVQPEEHEGMAELVYSYLKQPDKATVLGNDYCFVYIRTAMF